MKTPKWLIALIIILFIALIIVSKLFLPYQLKRIHARSVANKQIAYMKEEFDKGENITKVVAITQSRLTEEHASNSDFEYTIYTINLDEEHKTCQIDVKMSYGEHFEKFSTEKIEYERSN